MFLVCCRSIQAPDLLLRTSMFVWWPKIKSTLSFFGDKIFLCFFQAFFVSLVCRSLVELDTCVSYYPITCTLQRNFDGIFSLFFSRKQLFERNLLVDKPLLLPLRDERRNSCICCNSIQAQIQIWDFACQWPRYRNLSLFPLKK